ncbi:hypothetical protein C8J57DRAFT_555752 [Mycena rebaudengoi]|nr:hypothetical protein C8J57DRAFT_555752 [Mycena rebaudengoi]
MEGQTDPRGIGFDDLESDRETNGAIIMRAVDTSALALERSLVSPHTEAQTLHLPSDNSYPILTLPIDITVEIFSNFLPVYPERPPIAGLYSPELLVQVCRNWCEIALDTPWLWRAFQIYLHNRSPLDGQLNLLTTWLSHSKNCSLSLSCEIEHPSPSSIFPLLTAVLIS